MKVWSLFYIVTMFLSNIGSIIWQDCPNIWKLEITFTQYYYNVCWIDTYCTKVVPILLMVTNIVTRFYQYLKIGDNLPTILLQCLMGRHIYCIKVVPTLLIHVVTNIVKRLYQYFDIGNKVQKILLQYWIKGDTYCTKVVPILLIVSNIVSRLWQDCWKMS